MSTYSQTLWEISLMDSQIITSNQQFNFRGIILIIEHTLLAKVLNIEWFPLQIWQVWTFVEMFRFWGWGPPQVDSKVPYPEEARVRKIYWTCKLYQNFDPESGWENLKKKNKRKTKVSKPWNFTTTWQRHLWTDLNQSWCVCRSYRHSYVCQNNIWNMVYIGLLAKKSPKNLCAWNVHTSLWLIFGVPMGKKIHGPISVWSTFAS